MSPPVIAIDGPAAVGKGTVARLVAKKLGFVHLDTGRFYRAVGHCALAAEADMNDPASVLASATVLRDPKELARLLASTELNDEEVGAAASMVAKMPPVREALLDAQRDVGAVAGVVADGRDMASIVFPDAILKVFLDGDDQIRIERMMSRAKESRVDSSKMRSYLEQFKERDQRDTNRGIAPVVPAEGAHVIATDKLGIDEVVARVIDLYEQSAQAR